MCSSDLQEQEPDFSAKICEDLSFDDLDPMAISLMKKGYAQKQKNPLFEQLSIEQTLSDLRLIDNKGNFTYACLILLGKKEIIQTKLPQCKVVWEFRNLFLDEMNEFPYYTKDVYKIPKDMNLLSMEECDEIFYEIIGSDKAQKKGKERLINKMIKINS